MVLAGCSTGEPDAHDAGAHTGGGRLPSAHVHGVAVNPADDRVYLATHDGLFRYGEDGASQVGPTIDLMGFTVAGPDHFYASGHPGPGVDLPQPVGLIESTDGGETWTALSRQGESDFHTLASSEGGVVGFDGALRATSDGETWRELDPPVAPFALATSPDGTVVLATSESGPFRSSDAGVSWVPMGEAPLLQVVDWASGATVVGVTPEGTVAVSADAGETWTVRGAVEGPPQALGAEQAPDGTVRVLVVTADDVEDSRDGGATFSTLAM